MSGRTLREKPFSRSLGIYSDTAAALQKYADEIGLSRSELIRVLMRRYVERKVKVPKRTKSRLEVWIPEPRLWHDFSAAVEKNNVQVAAAIDAAFKALKEEK